MALSPQENSLVQRYVDVPCPSGNTSAVRRHVSKSHRSRDVLHPLRIRLDRTDKPSRASQRGNRQHPLLAELPLQRADKMGALPMLTSPSIPLTFGIPSAA